MKTVRLVLSLLPACAAVAASAQTLGDKAVRIAVPNVTFTRALNGAEDGMAVSADVLTLTSPAKRDNFRDPDGKLSSDTAPALLTRVDNTRPFTMVTRVTPTFRDVYDAGALYIWVRNDLWLKMAFELDERRRSRMVTVRTTGTSDDNNHDVVTAKGVFMKMSSDTKTIGFYYSLDQQSWQLIRLFRNDYPADIWLGISAQSPVGRGMEARFDSMSLTQSSIADFRLGK